jgi:hypothetical protein
MSRQEQIRAALKAFSKEHGPLQTMLATVVSVDESELTCVVDNDGTEIFDVQLRPVINGKESVTLIPKVDSQVLMARIEEDEAWMVIAADEITKLRCVVDDCEFEIENGFLIKKGEDSLKQIIQLIIEAVQQIVVMQGNNPDYAKLVQATEKLNNVLK